MPSKVKNPVSLGVLDSQRISSYIIDVDRNILEVVVKDLDAEGNCVHIHAHQTHLVDEFDNLTVPLSTYVDVKQVLYNRAFAEGWLVDGIVE